MVYAPVSRINSSNICDSVLCFISIVSTFSTGSWSDGVLEVVVLLTAAGDAVAESEVMCEGSCAVKCMLIVASVSGVCSLSWSTVIGTAGLWYFIRTNWCRQNFLLESFTSASFTPIVSVYAHLVYLGPLCPPLIFAANRICIRLTFWGSIIAPGPMRMARSFVCSLRIRCARDGILMEHGVLLNATLDLHVDAWTCWKRRERDIEVKASFLFRPRHSRRSSANSIH